jgi:N-acetyl-anhydromuramyl-L-alanine amidase AmpD
MSIPNLIQVPFLESQYVKEETNKTQIYLHHTAGNASGVATFKFWESNKERVATCVCISGPGANDGQVVQGFSSKYWAFHLGLKESTFNNVGLPYKSIDKNSIGIEICNWGNLTKVGDKFFTYTNREIPANEVIELDVPYKGQRFFHNYSNAQIESVKNLLLLWKVRYNIPLKYRDDIWQISKNALSGVPGVYTHNSVRNDKIDIYPHPKMIEMLKSLN